MCTLWTYKLYIVVPFSSCFLGLSNKKTDFNLVFALWQRSIPSNNAIHNGKLHWQAVILKNPFILIDTLISKEVMTKITSDQATFSALTLHSRYLGRHTMLEETRCVTTQGTVAQTVCPVPRASKTNQPLPCDWLSKWPKWRYRASSGLSALSRKKRLFSWAIYHIS